MAKQNRITLILAGAQAMDGRIRLSAFSSGIQSFTSALARVSKEPGGAGASAVFDLEELSYNSPMRLVVGPTPEHEIMASIALKRFEAVAAATTTGGSLDEFDADLLGDIRSLAKSVGKHFAYATIIINNNHFDMNAAVVRRVDEALEADEECEGTIEGRLERINIHEGANTFHIYPEIGPRKVSCQFHQDLLDDAISAIGRRVSVSGTMKYRHGASFPGSIVVSAIEAFPPDEDLPDWEDLRGLAPDATGQLRSEAFVRRLRDAW